ncbi:MAG TPA: indole-3-glycerol phosphate synthase TrpC [Holophaga sp.]|nr:indole-3-glycerol phosphate synthase TrpC [Holophaga sp.]HPS66427.1 indole-3-glycerol phosphate synthase TrpC [Holophaga sp.]
MSWLSEHYATRRLAAERRSALLPERELRARASRQAPPIPFAAALARGKAPAVIAEIKFRSPSEGELRNRRDAAFVARSYELNGAAALSVLIDETHFSGRLDYLAEARMATGLPVLAKGFLVDRREILEARLARADAVLLIAACLARAELAEMHALARELGMDALVELHGEEDFRKIEGLPLELVGVNHRNLDTLALDMDLSRRLAPRLPAGVAKVAESGISTPADLHRMAGLGFDAVLVGTRFMKRPDPGAALNELLGAAS